MRRRVVLLLLLLAMGLVCPGCPMITPVRPPSAAEMNGAWVGPSSRGAVWRFVLGPNGTGTASVSGESNVPNPERLQVRSWRLNEFDIEIVTDAPVIMGVPTIRFDGKVRRNTLALHHASPYWGQDLIMQRENELARSLEDLRGAGP